MQTHWAAKLDPREYPSRCAFYPQRTADPDGFILGEELEPPPGRKVQQAVSMAGLREVARKHAQMVDQATLDTAIEEVGRLMRRVDELESELAENDEFNAHIDGFAKKGYMIKRVPGRPRKEKVAD